MKKTLLLLFTLAINFHLSAQWVEITPPPSDFRTDHTFGFAIDGTGYLVTGTTPTERSDNFYSYSPENDTWTQLPDFPGGTRGFGIGDVWNGKAYFGFGAGTSPDGTSGRKNDLWEFDPATGEWKELASCPCDARIHPTFVAHKGNIYVGLGGVQGVGNVKDWWQYNIETDTWTQKTDFPSHERHHPYQFAIGDYVYTGFGHGTAAPLIYVNWYRYDPELDEWDEVASIPGEARVAGTQFSHEGKGYVLSGDGEDHQSMEVGEFWEYDAELDSWTELPPHPGFSRWAPASFIIDNEVYIINGSSFGNYQDKAYKYNFGGISSSESTDLNSEIKVYPNPFSDKVIVEANIENVSSPKQLSFKAYDVLGNLLIEQTLASRTHDIQLEGLNTGVYILHFFQNEEFITAKKITKK